VSKRVSALLEEVLTSIRLIGSYTSPLSNDDFVASVQVQDAVLRRIEIIGEGVKSIPPRIAGCATSSFIAILVSTWTWSGKRQLTTFLS